MCHMAFTIAKNFYIRVAAEPPSHQELTRKKHRIRFNARSEVRHLIANTDTVRINLRNGSIPGTKKSRNAYYTTYQKNSMTRPVAAIVE